MEFCIFHCLSLHVPPSSLHFSFLCVYGLPGLLTLHCHLTLLVVTGCHTAVYFPITEPPLVTNSESSPAAGPKSQLENSETQHLKLPSEDCPKFLQLLPSSLSLLLTATTTTMAPSMTELQFFGCNEHNGSALWHYTKPKQCGEPLRACWRLCDRAATSRC